MNKEFVENDIFNFCDLEISDELGKKKIKLSLDEVEKAIDKILDFSIASLYRNKKLLLILEEESREILFEKLNIKFLKENENKLDYKMKEYYKNIKKSKNINSKVNVIIRELEKKYKILDDIKEVLLSERENGITLLDMYMQTDKRIISENTRYGSFVEENRKRKFSEYNYYDLENCVKYILEEGLVEKYIKYRRLSKNRILDSLKKEISTEKINDGIKFFDKINFDKEKYVVFLEKDKYWSDFLENYQLECPKVESIEEMEEYIEEVSSYVNEKYNGELLNKKASTSWFKKLLFSNRKKDKEVFDKNIQEFKKRCEEIKGIYSKNLCEILRKKKEIDFLKDILTEEYYNKLVMGLVLGENIYKELNLIKNVIGYYNYFKKVEKIINNLSSNELSILEYAYENVDNRADITKAIKEVPMLSILVKIEEIEEIESKRITNYKGFELILSDIRKLLKVKRRLIYEEVDYYIKGSLIDKDNCIEEYPFLYRDYDNIDKINQDNYLYIIEVIAEEKEIQNRKENKIRSQIKEFLNKNRYKIKEWVEVEGYFVDLAIYGESEGKPLLILDFDYSIYTEGYDSKEVELYKRRKFYNKEINVLRIWTRDWWISPKDELIRIKETIEELIEKELLFNEN